MTRIDVGTVLRHSAKLPYSNLVTRSTGAAVRRCIEQELALLPADETATLDFSQIGMMDFSCADEVVAKLLQDPPHGTPARTWGIVTFHGITDHHLEAIEDVLQPMGVGVVIEAYHLCMMMRGVEKQNSKTLTSALRGNFRDDAMTRDEFLRLAHGPSSPLR